MHVAIYARVSTERQERQQIIDSKLAALRSGAVADVVGNRGGVVSGLIDEP
jgi:DNA invertase Pin-like site-specific DNA recombinase